jgi:hypothetical protein
VSNRYTELITEVNEAIGDLQSGKVTVAKATEATNAGYAASAGNASSASYATSAGQATRANGAGFAVVYDGPIGKSSVSLPLTNSVYLVDLSGATMQNENARLLEVFYVPNCQYDCSYGGHLEYKANNGTPMLYSTSSEYNIFRVIKIVGT